MKLAVLFSGGKDSCLALHITKEKGHEICCLLNIMTENPDSYMFHKPDVRLLRKQADELGVKLVLGKSKGEKEKELEDLRELIKSVKDEIDGIVVGGIASSYQGNRIKKICEELKLNFIAPLWNYSAEKLWDELLKENFKVVMTKIACQGIGKEWIGKVIDKDNFEELKKLAEKYRFRIDFEGGEAETAVLYMPEFKKKIEIDFQIISESENRHLMKIKKIK